jgi:hypothetical protein
MQLMWLCNIQLRHTTNNSSSSIGEQSNEKSLDPLVRWAPPDRRRCAVVRTPVRMWRRRQFTVQFLIQFEFVFQLVQQQFLIQFIKLDKFIVQFIVQFIGQSQCP